MKSALAVALATGCLALGVGLGLAAKSKETNWPGIQAVRGKPPKEAAAAALELAEQAAKDGTWERLGVARVYYLSGDKPRGQRLIDQVMTAKLKGNDWQRIGQIYAEAGENQRAEEYFAKVLAFDEKDDTGQAEIGAWYIRQGQREKGEELLAKAFARHPDEVWHYLRAAEAYLNLTPR